MFREMVECLPIPVMLWKPQGEEPAAVLLLFANQAAVRESGAPVKWWDGGTVGELFPETLDLPAPLNPAMAVIRVWQTGVSEWLENQYGDATPGGVPRSRFQMHFFKLEDGVACIYRAE